MAVTRISGESKELKESKGSESKEISVREAQESKEYWSIMGYRHEMLAAYQLQGFTKIAFFVKKIEGLLPRQKRQLTKRLVDAWLLSSHVDFSDTQFDTDPFSPEMILEKIRHLTSSRESKESKEESKEELKRVEVIDLRSIQKLYISLSRIREKWKKEIFSPRLTQRFVQFPTDRQFEDIADKIQQGKWDLLDLQNPYFLQHVVKAFHKRLINTDDFLTAQFIYATFDRFAHPIEVHPYDEKSHFDIRYFMPYVSKDQIKQFHKNLESAPKHQQCYFSVSIPHEQMIFYFFWSLNEFELYRLHPYKELLCFALSEYIARLNIKSEDKIRFEEVLESFEMTADYDPEINKELMQHICQHEEEAITGVLQDRFSSSRQKILYESTNAWLTIIYADEPTVFLRVNADKSKPILSIFLPSMGSLNVLMKTLYKEHAVCPQPIIGSLSTLQMKKINRDGSHRGVSAFLPGIIKHPLDAHGLTHDYYTFMGHDILNHVVRESENPHKKLYLYLINLVETVKNTQMDTFIWAAVDKDLEYHSFLMARLKASSDREAYAHQKRLYLLEDIFRAEFYDDKPYPKEFHSTDITLVILFDLLKNKPIWDNLVRDDLYHETAENLLLDQYKDPSKAPFLEKCKRILSQFPAKSYLFYVIAFHLPEENWALLTLIDANLRLENYFKWGKTDFPGYFLYFKSTPKNLKMETFATDPIHLHTIIKQGILENITKPNADRNLIANMMKSLKTISSKMHSEIVIAALKIPNCIKSLSLVPEFQQALIEESASKIRSRTLACVKTISFSFSFTLFSSKQTSSSTEENKQHTLESKK